MTKPVRAIAAICIGLLFALLVLEGGLRIAGIIWHICIDQQTMDVPDRPFTICCLGESTTASGRFPYPVQLEFALRELFPDRSFRIINMGVPGTNSTKLVEHLESRIMREPGTIDLIVAMMGINDRRHDELPMHIPARLDHPFFRFFKTWRLFQYSLSFLHSQEQNRDLQIFSETGEKQDKFHPEGSAHWNRDSYRRERLPEPEIMVAQQDRLQVQQILLAELAINPESAVTWCKLGNSYCHGNNLEAAKEAYYRAIALAPDYLHCYRQLITVLRSGKQCEELARLAFRVTPETARETSILVNAGKCFEENCGPEKAICFYREAMQQPAAAAELFINGIYSLLSQGFKTEAEQFLQRAVDRFPEEPSLARMASTFFGDNSMPNPVAASQQRTVQVDHERLSPITAENYLRLAGITQNFAIPLFVMQYPRRSIDPLRNLLGNFPHVHFVDNSTPFEIALQRYSYSDLFYDCFAGDFGHAKMLGNLIIARNLASRIARFLNQGQPVAQITADRPVIRQQG